MTELFFLQAGGLGGSGALTPVFLVLMLAVFYFFLIRPQQKKAKEQETFISDLKKGDRVVTMGGLHGKILQISEDKPTVLLQVDDNAKIKVEKSVISMEYTKSVTT